MFNKISAALVGTLVVAAQASYPGQYGHIKHHHVKRHYGPQGGYGPVSNQTSTAILPPPTVAPTSGVPTSVESLPPPSASSFYPSIPLTTGGSVTPTIPLSTGISGSGGPLPTETGDTTLTYTLGTGSSTTVVTTTVKHTLTETDVHVRRLSF